MCPCPNCVPFVSITVEWIPRLQTTRPRPGIRERAEPAADDAARHCVHVLRRGDRHDQRAPLPQPDARPHRFNPTPGMFVCVFVCVCVTVGD